MRRRVLRAAALVLWAILFGELVVVAPPVIANEAAPSFEAWSAGLRSPDPVRRRSAAEEATFFRSDRRAAMPALANALGDPDLVVRRLVAKTLADFASPADAPLATRLAAAAANEKEAYVRLQITRALVAVGVSDPVVKRALEDRRRDPDATVARTATTALRGDASAESPTPSAATPQGGMRSHERPLAPPRLFVLGAEPAAPDPAWSRREQEIEALAKRGPAALPELTRLLADPDGRVRLRAIAQLKKLGPEAASAAPDLVRAVASPDDSTRRFAVDALRAMGPGAAAVVPQLIDFLDAPDARVRWSAAEALATFGPLASPAVPRLAAAAGAEGDRDTVLTGIRTLGALGPAAAGAAPTLRAQLRNENGTIAVAAARALWAVEGNASLTLPVLVAALKSSAPGVACEAARGLGDLGPAAEPATEALLDALADDKIPYLHSTAYNALAKIGEPVVPHLLLAVSDPDPDRARSTQSLLRQIEQRPSQ